ncbi:MAG: DinB family protein [Acidobacteria bacterium]|nr:DinB family protein [Acidobacteriota bacterium]
MNTEFVADFSNSVLQAYEELQTVTEEKASEKPHENQWSVKELLGHLLDSASNNHQRFVRLQIFDEIEFPFYQQDDFVRANHYQKHSWKGLLEFWKLYNLHLVHIIENLDPSKLNNVWITPDNERLTLEHIVEDYLRHLNHHLEQIKNLLD